MKLKLKLIMQPYFYLFQVIFSLLSFTNSQTCDLDDAFGCANRTLSSDAIDVSVNGYKTLSGSEGGVWIGSYSIHLSCRATRSCEKLSYAWSLGSIYCHGDQSCANIQNMTTFGSLNQTICWGPASCANTHMSSQMDVFCQADFSCAYTTITGRPGYIQFTGAYSGYGSNIVTPGDGSHVQMLFYGYYSGYNATIICTSGDHCDVDCDGNSCQNLFVVCEEDSQCHCKFFFVHIYSVADQSFEFLCVCFVECIMYNVHCTIYIVTCGSHDVCPHWNVSEIDYNLVNPIEFRVDTLELSEEREYKCNNNGDSMRLDDYFASNSVGMANVETTNDGANICCRGAWSCYSFASLTTSGNESDIICSTYVCVLLLFSSFLFLHHLNHSSMCFV